MTRTSDTDRSFDVHALGSDGEGEVVEAVAGSSHLPHEELSKWRALLDKREYHYTSGQKLFNAIAADEPRTLHYLRCHQCCAADVLQQ